MIAALIRVGHANILTYGYSFFKDVSEELTEHEQSTLTMTAYANRVAGASNEDWKKFIASSTPKQEVKERKKMSLADHKKIAQSLKGI